MNSKMGSTFGKAATRVTDILGNPDDWDDDLKLVTEGYVQDRITEGVRAGAIEAGLPPELAVVNPDVLEWADRYTTRLARRINETTEKRIADSMGRVMQLYDAGTIREAIDKGATLPQMRDAVLEALGSETNRFRAEMTAATEFARAEQSGRLDQLRSAGAVRKVWVANPDCCEFCAEMDGTEVEIDGNFLNLGDAIEIDNPEGDGTLSLVMDYEDVDIALAHPFCRCSYSVSWE